MKQNNDSVWKTEPYSIFQGKHFDVPKAFYRDARIRYSPDSLRDCSGVKSSWPDYAIRGRPVSPELAMEIIRKTDLYRFYCVTDEGPRNEIERMFQRSGVFAPDNYSDSYDMTWFPYEDWVRCGWCHPDGYIGINGYSCKWPTLRNLLEPWVYLIQNVTLEMDLVAVITECKEWLDNFDDSLPIEQEIACGFLVHGDTVTLLTRDMAQKLFRRYDRLYGDHRPLGPLADPRTMPEEKEHLKHVTYGDHPMIQWSYNGLGCNYPLEWEDIPDEQPGKRSNRIDYLPPLPGKVDKNSPIFYGVPDSTFATGPLTMADMAEFVRLWKQERTGMCTEGLAIAALGEHGPEQVTDLETTEHKLLFVMADYVDEDGIRALSRCKARLRGEGKDPFFIQCGEGYQAHVPETANPFDLWVDCGFDNKLPLKLPAEIITSLLPGHDLADLDAEDVLPVLHRPGTMFCFEESASWEERPGPTFEALCHTLEKLVKGPNYPIVKPGDDLRVFVQLLCSPNIGLEEMERCVRSLAEDEQRNIFFRFQGEFRDELPDHTIVVRGLIGSMENREAPLWRQYPKREPEPLSDAAHDD